MHDIHQCLPALSVSQYRVLTHAAPSSVPSHHRPPSPMQLSDVSGNSLIPSPMPPSSSPMQLSYVAGNSVMMDFTFQAYYAHLGHWLEMMLPLYNVLLDGSWVEHAKV